MGDRTYVTLTVLTEHAVDAINLIREEQGDPCDEDSDSIDGLTLLSLLGYEEVNYGTIEALAGFAAAGIPYSVSWGSGGCYTEGERHLRFSPEGEPHTISQEKDWPINALLDLKMAWEKEPDKPLEQHLQEAIAKSQDPSWENQFEHSKIARTRNLLNPQ